MKAVAKSLRSLVAVGAAWRVPRAAGVADDRATGDTACRNCGADAPGSFCPACGQETSLRLPNARQFMGEATGRYVAFDGRMWRTLFPLLFRPGFLTREYLAGRRRRYVRPGRLVLVLAIVLFAVARWLTVPSEVIRIGADEQAASEAPANPGTTPATASSGRAPVGKAPDATARKPAIIEMDKEPLKIGGPSGGLTIDEGLNVRFDGPPSALGERIGKRFEGFNQLGREQKEREIIAGMMRYGPYALIALLPAFALMMQILYLGRSRRYPLRPRSYAEHLVFGAHNHAFLALALTLMIAVPSSIVTVALALWCVLYLPVSMRAVYGGRWTGAIARAFVTTIVYAVLFVIAVLALLVAAVVLR
ncbi:MAG: DUF3667 domain-containing protein [Betaproteobacteria bacterium]